ncbi:MAG TPA: YkgJ family cysteine cluster protein [Fimbriimonas sp.]|nr:YkgJ family cysteine cluster protein [Fimbriimonas sp.]
MRESLAVGKASRKKLAVRPDARQQTMAEISQALTDPQRLIQLGEEIEAKVDALISRVFSANDRLRNMGKPLPQVACRRGCSWCCHTMRVLATPLEILTLAAYLRSTRSVEELADLLAKLKAYDSQMHVTSDGLPAAQLMACPFLSDEGACTVYPARPIGCRGFHSLNVERCQRRYSEPTFGEIPQFIDIFDQVGPVTIGIWDGLQSRGLRGSPLLLARAMVIALEIPDAADRYLAGEDIFASATSPEIERSARQQSLTPNKA